MSATVSVSDGLGLHNRAKLLPPTYWLPLWLTNLSTASFSAVARASAALTFTSGSTPVPSQSPSNHRADGMCIRHADCEVVTGRKTLHRMSSSARRLSYDRGSFLSLQVESEFLATRESLRRSKNIHRLIGKPRPGEPGECPVLTSLIFVSVGEVVDGGGFLRQVRNTA